MDRIAWHDISSDAPAQFGGVLPLKVLFVVDGVVHVQLLVCVIFFVLGVFPVIDEVAAQLFGVCPGLTLGIVPGVTVGNGMRWSNGDLSVAREG